MVLLFHGLSGAGKHTQANIFDENYDFAAISSGDVLRIESASGSELGSEIKSTMEEGRRVPDEITYSLLERYMEGIRNNNLVLTGLVRTPEQIELLDMMLAKKGLSVDKVIYFELTDQEAKKRLEGRWYTPRGDIYHAEFNPPPQELKSNLSKRKDDYPEAIEERIKEFNNNNPEILKKYEERKLLVKIDASQDIETVTEEIKKAAGIT